MASKLDICNTALAMVSTQFMTSDSETTPQGNACNAILPSRVDNLMEIAVWDWAIIRARLSTDSTSADADLYPDFEHVYDFPDNAVRIAGMVRPRNQERESIPTFTVEGRLILTAETTPIIRYVRNPRGDVYGAAGAVLTPEYEIIRGPALVLLQTMLAVELAVKFQRDEQMAQRLALLMQRLTISATRTITPASDYPSTGLESNQRTGLIQDSP